MQLINLAPQGIPAILKKPERDHISVPVNRRVTTESISYDSSGNDMNDSIQENREQLMKDYPGKLLFSIKDTSVILGVSYEFVRRTIHSGSVQTRNFGGRMMIHLNELSKLITKGITTS